MKKYYTIPIFIPEKACPFRCIYCNQYRIAGCIDSPSEQEIKVIIEKYLETFPPEATVRAGFFGGSFTGMSMEEQTGYLEIVKPYIEQGKIDNIQLSTHPDYISLPILENLKKYNVRIIELGAQSLDENVLKISGRGHTVEEVEKASRLVVSEGFELGLQMMIGLPSDTMEKSIITAHRIVSYGAVYTRIYPTLVIRNTDLESMYISGKYKPLTMEEAIQWSSNLVEIFEKAQVTILRMGLHPSEGLVTGNDLVDGPFHVSFRELVLSFLWKKILSEKTDPINSRNIVVEVAPDQLNYAVGYGGANKKMLLQRFDHVSFRFNPSLTGRDLIIK